MKLDKIVLNGFKSFADKTEFLFDAGITCIVGPNGCGKSNVVDAIKWVLGEQSAKSLRSGQMADVIFSGSSSRKSLGMAEVCLFFSDAAGLGTEHQQVEISRRLYRSGESEYLINNKVCRLKDVKELFMDTGVGVRAYSIIEQGQIDQLLTASKFDRRTIFEEAAGISKYKAHKKEALRKLERTEQNLLRLADIVNEVQKQLRSTKLQAGKARSYLEYTERLKELRVNYSLSEYHRIKVGKDEKQTLLKTFEDNLSAVLAEVSRNDAIAAQVGREIIETGSEINRTDNGLVAAKSKIDQQLERINYLSSRLTELESRRQTERETVGRLRGQNAVLTENLNRSALELEKCDRTLAEKNAFLTRLEQELHQINMECSAIDTSLQDEKSGIIDIVRRTAQLHNEIKSLGSYRDNLAGQKEKIAGKASAARSQMQQLLTEKAHYEARLADIAKVLEQLQQNLIAKRSQMEQIGSRLAAENEKLASAKEHRSALQSEISVLADMESKREGLNRAVKAILQKRAENTGSFNYVEGILADIVRADSEYAAAVEAALEGKTDALVVNSRSDFLKDSDALQKLEGRVNALCLDRTEPFADTADLSKYTHIRGRLTEFVSYEDKYSPLVWQLLGHTLLTDTIEAAIELSAELGGEYTFVTSQGQRLSGKGMISVGPMGKSAGLISRKSRLTQLKGELEKLSIEITHIQESLETSHQENEHLTKLCQDLRTAVYEANTEKMDATSKFNVTEQNLRQLGREEPILAGEIDMLQAQIAESVQKEYESKQKLDELEAVNIERNAHIASLEKTFTETKQLQQVKLGGLTTIKVELGQISEQRKAVQQSIISFESQLQQGKLAVESAKTEIACCDEEITRTNRNILSSETAVSELFLEKDRLQAMSKQLHEKDHNLQEQQRQTEHILREKRAQQNQTEQQIHAVRLDMSQLQVKHEDLIQRVQEELQINLEEAYSNYRQENIDWESIRAEIAELRGKIERLGNVNVDSIDQLDELDKRNNFLTSQVEDLKQSKLQLEQLINRINKDSKDRFVETFEQVRANFQTIFRKLFGGGKADVVLEDPEDVLECGIEIIARPPGKEPRSISLLSGGEKTMTAISLLFAIFKTKPSPFCFLDEVDAALDEANNERFNLMIQEFRKESQFVVITHSKRTMSIGNVLFGITMQQQGVSKKISVKFDQVDSQTPAAVA